MTAIYLIGPRGVGKSEVGRVLADSLSFPFNDQDLSFHKKFKHEGKLSEQHKADAVKFFRRQFEILKEISDKNTVISVGASNLLKDGDKELDDEKISFCRKHGCLIMIIPSEDIEEGAEICFERDKNRPDIGIFGNAYPPEEFRYYHERYLIWMQYKDIADFIILNNTTIEDCVEKIKKRLREENILKD